ncbi:MAG: thioredoxin [Anaerolineae bacterium]|nr:thioredoxin [Gemmatimonadaceae bacterium]
MYPDERVARFVAENFIPVRVHVREQAEEFKRLGAKYAAQWTPTILVLDSDGAERHRIEGFLPVEDFLAQLALGRAHAEFRRGAFSDAQQHFAAIVDQYPESEVAAEGLYWSGVSRYKATNDPAALGETAQNFKDRFQDSSWAKKASVWNR